MKCTRYLAIITLIGACACLMAVVTPTTVRAQTTDAMPTKWLGILNANMPPRNDPVAVAHLFAKDGVQYHPFGASGTQRGREALQKFFAGFENFRAAWTHIEHSRTIQGRRAVWEGVAQGTHKEAGTFVKLPIVFFLEFDERGKVKRNRVYGDVHLIGEQTAAPKRSAEEHTAIIRRWFEEGINQGNLAVVDELFASDFVFHEPAGDVRGREALKRAVPGFRTAFPDMHITIEDQIVTGDKVVTRWTTVGTHQGAFMGIAPTGKRVTLTGIYIYRLAEGKIVELWTSRDDLGFLQQLGVISPLERGGE